MRHPTTGLSEDDLSRLTGSSSSTASADSSSSSSSSSAANTPAHKECDALDENNAHSQHQNPEKVTTLNISNNNNNNNKNSHSHSQLTSSRFSSTYLPEFINPLEWQKSRKRKERLDSSCSSTQDRKLQRSNSEELLPAQQQQQQHHQHSAGKASAVELETTTAGAADAGGNALKASKTADVIRRVSSEDFKKTRSYAAYEQELLKEPSDSEAVAVKDKQKSITENDSSLANRQNQQNQQQQHHESRSIDKLWISGPIAKDMTRRTRYETSPARSQRHSPIRSSHGYNNNKYRDSDDSECEHERRRSSERFCKTRAPPGRKASGVIKKSSSSSSSSSKYLHGAASKRNDENVYAALKYERRGFISKKVIANAEKADHNDNNLIDFHQQKQPQSQPNNTNNAIVSPTPSSSSSSSTGSDEPTTVTAASTSSAPTKKTNNSIPPITSAQEALPWGRCVPDDQAPMLSRRYAAVRHHPGDSIDTAAKLSKVMPYPQFHKPLPAAQRLVDDMDCIDSYRAFTSLENFHTHEVLQQVMPAMMSFQTPDERLKYVNKRMTAMKKKLIQLEEAFEARMGYRPSQAERLNDKHMKNVLAELSKLRKERHELRVDPMGAVGLKVSGGMDATKKLEKMKGTLLEIEQNLQDKREDANRSEVLDELTSDQLVQEKSAVQHGLLYFESMCGRPNSKEERDAARTLYERYRQLKRMVSRSCMLSGSAVVGAPELPTILEHEAMVFESTPLQYSSNNSTDTTNSPTESVAQNPISSDDSTTTTTTNNTAAAAPEVNENINDLSLDQLWVQLEKAREDKKLLKCTIRDYEQFFEEQNGRKMLKSDRRNIEETYAQYREKKAKARLLQALIRKKLGR